ncbi:MAG TPA: DUF4272 domain-containing protein [Candidatus Ruthenibacterium merdigallinarum]|nr:DUF4272 domain-containing protein [Candidatus Ruthenibacterium merdigallinarum]
MSFFDRFKKNDASVPKSRRMRTIAYLEKNGIAYNKYLPLVEGSDEVTCKGMDEICRRMIASLLATQVACDLCEGHDAQESREFFTKELHKFGVADALLAKEKRVFDGSASEQEALDVVWNYEAYWAIAWAMGLVGDIRDASDACDCQKAIDLVMDCDSYEQFKARCVPRGIEELLDMLDLFYCYHWACVEKDLHPETNIGSLCSEVVWERRKGLEWLICSTDDWDEISLDT